MNKIFKYQQLLLPIVIFILLNSTYAGTIRISKVGKVRTDTSIVKVRMPSERKINEFRSKKEFQYEREDKLQQLLQSINKRINEFLSNLFGSMEWKPPSWVNFQNIIIFFSLIIFLLLIYLTIRSNLGGIFYKKNINDLFNNGVIIEDIEEIDFDSLIQEYLKNGDYRMTVRMLYHKILKELSIAGIIKWKIEKTNDDYINEIMDDPIKSGFIELTRFFNYVWYGMFNIDKNDFDEINNKFNEFIVDINTGD